MKKLLVAVTLFGTAIVYRGTCARSQQLVSSTAATKPGNISSGKVLDNGPGNLDSLPPLPRGKTTIIGGEIRNFDPVRDQFSLRIYGQRPMKILFDERTQVYRDGVRIPVRDLGPEDHASVQTTLDGANVFAVSIHILSRIPEGECDGRILSFNPNTGELAIASSMSPEPVRLYVPANVSIARVGEPEFTASSSGLSDLVPGSLVSASFEPGAAGRNVTTQIKVLAVPGAAFVFSGNVSFLDMDNGVMVVVDPRDDKSYQIRFDAALLPTTKDLRTGANVTVRAIYDGARYAANEITEN